MAGQDARTLARKYRGKGQSDEQVYNTLRSLGIPKRDARSAVDGLKPAGRPGTLTTGPATKPAAAAPGPAPSSPAPPSSGSSSLPSLPSFSPPDLTSVTLTPPKKLNASDLGGFLAGLTIFVLFTNYLRYGPDGVRGWFAAKFLNQPINLEAGRVPRRNRAESSGLTSTRPAKPAAV